MRRIMGLALGLTLAASAQAELLITDFLVETKVLGKSTDPDGELRPYIPIVSYIPNSGYTRRAMDRSDDNRLGLPWDRTPGHPPFSPAKPKAPKLPVFARSAEFLVGVPESRRDLTEGPAGSMTPPPKRLATQALTYGTVDSPGGGFHSIANTRDFTVQPIEIGVQ